MSDAIFTLANLKSWIRAIPRKHQTTLLPRYVKWDSATHAPVATVTAARAVPADERANGMSMHVTSKQTPYYWIPASTETDDGDLYLKPDDVTLPAAGRWHKGAGASGSGTAVDVSVVNRSGSAITAGTVLQWVSSLDADDARGVEPTDGTLVIAGIALEDADDGATLQARVIGEADVWLEDGTGINPGGFVFSTAALTPGRLRQYSTGGAPSGALWVAVALEKVSAGIDQKGHVWFQFLMRIP
ncbi:MAG: hypothetical protein WC789_10720 [Lentisphaeria bacterium]